ncbi:MAG: stage II sporulation protein P [Firmicutes bacterium]|nr:stage II sporulation protein P [Bacillota bacterium]
MFAGKYRRYFHKQRMAARQRFLKKSPRNWDFIPQVILLGLMLTLIFSASLFGASIVFHGSNLKTFFREGLKLDYATFICHSLPGMNKNSMAKETDGNFTQETWPSLGLTLETVPELLLRHELAGLLDYDLIEKTDFFGHIPAFTSDYMPEHDIEVEADAPRQELEDEGISFLVDKKSEKTKEKLFLIKDDKPLVLIYHTHASESFIPVSNQAFSSNPELTVVSLGAYLAKLLEDRYGIPVLHHTEVFDVPRRSAYQKARPCIEQVLKENPQIQVVLDIHRDGVSRRITTADAGGVTTAKILFVIGTQHKGWSSNLRFALFLEKALSDKYPDFSRNIRRQASVYNQDLHPRSLIIEIGGHENNRDEITRAVSCFAETVAMVFR